jgi:hypothetical protein
VRQPPSQTSNVRCSTGTRTVTDSPGCASTFANPASHRAGRSAVSSSGATYTCTTSRPARTPVLVTVTSAYPPETASASYRQVV